MGTDGGAENVGGERGMAVGFGGVWRVSREGWVGEADIGCGARVLR